MTRATVPILCIALMLAILSPTVAAEDGSDWKSMKQDAKRAKIDETADEALAELFAKSPKAKALYDKAYGWAVFDNLKIVIGFAGGGGNGVAVNKQSGKRTYMQMGTAGVSLGLGGKKYQLVFLFQDQKTFSSFVDKGWQADTSASAVGGTAGVSAEAGFVNGMAIFGLNEAGLMASADVSGTKYWKNGKLNN